MDKINETPLEGNGQNESAADTQIGTNDVTRAFRFADNGDGTYCNPILYTDYSDPDVIRVGDDYYLVASSFCNTPAIPVLHSRDLVNWEILSYVLENIPDDSYTDAVRHGCGVWAPAIRYHNGDFMVFYPMPDEGIFMCRAKDPAGPWSEPVCVKAAKGWIDPCPFWDEDGKAYLVNAFAKSRIGFKSILHISGMSPDGTRLLDEGRDVFDGHRTQPTIEGPKLYRRNGWYYIFAPAGSVQSGWQTVLRSKNIYGPYEERIVMLQGGTRINGPHQGGWVDTPCGEDWFIHFQDVGNAGRIVHLQPMTWENDWPVIGENSGEGYGTPVGRSKKPALRGGVQWPEPGMKDGIGRTMRSSPVPACAPPDSDDFAGDRPGLQWQWNGNHCEDWYRMEKPGLRLFCLRPVQAALWECPGILLQKWTAPAFSVTAELDCSGLSDGSRAGIISFGRSYQSLFVKRCGDGLAVGLLTGTINEKAEQEDILTLLEGAALREIVLRLDVKPEGTGTLCCFQGGCRLTDEKHFRITPGYWTGAKFGFYAQIREGEAGCGSAGSVLIRYVRVFGGKRQPCLD